MLLDFAFALLAVVSLSAAVWCLIDDANQHAFALFGLVGLGILGIEGLVVPRIVRRTWARRVPVPATVIRLETARAGTGSSAAAYVRFTPPCGIEREGVVPIAGKRPAVGSEIVLQYDPSTPEKLTAMTADELLRLLAYGGLLFGVSMAAATIVAFAV